MNQRIQRTLIRPVLALTLVCLCCAADRGAPVAVGETRAAMQQIAGALEAVFPLLGSDETFAAPENRATLEAALGRLRDGASGLAQQGRTKDAGFAHLSEALARDVAEIQARFQQDRRDEARFLLGALAEDCVACHSRFPAGADSELGRRLYASADLAALGQGERLQLQVATRQFDAARRGYETLFQSAITSPTQLDLGGFLSDYLALCVRISGDLEGPRVVLDRFLGRPDVPEYLRHLVRTWSDALGSLELESAPEARVARARQNLAEAAQLRRFPADRASLVHDLVASSLLHRAVSADPPPADRAEAYLLLGLAELRIRHSYWLTEPEAYLEAAIRSAPGTDTARDAYTILEEETMAGFTGSSGAALPPEVDEWLAELRELALPSDGAEPNLGFPRRSLSGEPG